MARLLRRFLKPYRGLIALVVVLQLMQAMASLLLPTLNASVIDEGIAKQNISTIWYYGMLMLGVTAVQVVGQIAAAWCGSRTAMSFGRDVREAIFSKSLEYSSREVARFGAPSLITRNTNDVQQVQQIVLMTSIIIVSAPLTMIGGVVLALREDVGLSWLILVAVVVLGIVIVFMVSRMTPIFKKMQARIDTINQVLREQIAGLRVIRAFVREPTEEKRFDNANWKLTKTALSVGVIMATLFPLVFFILDCSSVAVMWFGGFRVQAGDIQVGQLTAYLSYLTQILMSVMMSTMMLMMGPRAVVSAERIMEVLDRESTVKEPENPVTDYVHTREIKFDDVAFRYPGAELPVVSGLTFDAAPGTVTGIIGSTGSGKTTMVNLIPRLFDATEGCVSLDGVNVKNLDLHDLWDHIGFVPQKPYLFTGTVAHNLRIGKPDATEQEIWEALEVAQARDFVEKLDGQLDYEIAQGGTNISGGQRQRLAIARALIRKPEVYVFDDAFSALDMETDARLRAALKPVTRDATVIIVAARISTIRDADQIIVMEHGRIDGIGTHEELLSSCQTYQEIVESQFQTEGV
jgi:ATP-binding cassette subfamily B protein